MPTRTGIAAVFSRLAACGCKPPVEVVNKPGEAVDAWLSVLYDVDDEHLAVAVVAYLREDKGAQWWPSPSALMSYTPRGSDLRRLGEAADEQWGEVVIMVNRHGRYCPPVETDRDGWTEAIVTRRGVTNSRPWRMSAELGTCQALEAGVRACGGWAALCAMDMAEQSAAARAAFRTAYRAMLGRGPKIDVVAMLEERGGPLGLRMIEGGKS